MLITGIRSSSFRNRSGCISVTTGRVIATEPVGYDNCDTVTVKTDDRGLVSFVGYGYEGGERVILFMYRNGTYDRSDDTVSGVWVR